MSSLPLPVSLPRQPCPAATPRRRVRAARATARSPRPRAVATPARALPSATRIVAIVLWAWCWAGLSGLLLFEGLRGSHPAVGWLPFWLLLWPAASLGLMLLRWPARS